MNNCNPPNPAADLASHVRARLIQDSCDGVGYFRDKELVGITTTDDSAPLRGNTFRPRGRLRLHVRPRGTLDPVTAFDLTVFS